MLMLRPPPRSTPPDPLSPYTSLFRSAAVRHDPAGPPEDHPRPERGTPMSNSERTIIIVHAWRWEDGNQTYSDPNVERVDGWCVYVRVPTGEPGEFDTPVEEDFPTQDRKSTRLNSSH